MNPADPPIMLDDEWGANQAEGTDGDGPQRRVGPALIGHFLCKPFRFGPHRNISAAPPALRYTFTRCGAGQLVGSKHLGKRTV